MRADAQDARVAVYLDGKAFHASPAADRTADDARKRTALRDDGYRVWSLTWEDVQDFARILDGHAAKQGELLDASAANRARSAVSDRRVATLWGNPVAALLAYLQDPGADVWEAAAVHTCLGLPASKQHLLAAPVATTAASLTDAIKAWARGETVPAEKGDLRFASCQGRSGLPVAIVARPNGVDTGTVGALTVLDDQPPEVGGPMHDERWREWLRWSNLLQFLTLPRYGHSMPLRMAEVWTARSLEELGGRTVPLAAPTQVVAPVVDVVSPRWRVVVEYTDPLLSELARRLSEVGVPVPEPGGEVGGSAAWQVEYSWPAEERAVVVDVDEDRDKWLAAHCWTVWRVDDTKREEDLVHEIASAFGIEA
jgi:very-short-patch-repair endonuclease